MIKRRFYKRGYGGGNSSDSSSSSSDSDSDSIPEVDEDEDDVVQEHQQLEQDDNGGESSSSDEYDDVDDEKIAAKRAKLKKKGGKRTIHLPSSGSGYESGDSSVNEVKVDSSGLLISEEDSAERGGQNRKDGSFVKKVNSKETAEGASNADDKMLKSDDPIQNDFADCILKCKSVFKCKLCPRIVCLSEESVKTHLNSKRHARSKNLLVEGRLKLMLNSDGEIEEDLETHAERHMRTVAVAQEPISQAKKDKGRQRQSRRRKKKQLRDSSSKGKPEGSARKPKKKQCKNEV